MAFIEIEYLKYRQFNRVTINTEEISSVADSYDGYSTGYYVEMKNGTRYWTTEHSYNVLRKKLQED